MPRILAIESDPKRRSVLSALVREHVKATLVVVPSVRAAIASIAEHTPDLIIAPTLLSPPDEAELLTHMKGLDSAPYIQMLTVPALDMLADAPADETRRRGLFGPVFNRRPVSLGLQYDRGMVAAQIVDGLARARALRIEYATMLAYQEAMGSVTANSSIVLARAGDVATLDVSSARVYQEQLREQARDERRIPLRKGRGDILQWLSGIKASWGADLQLINISSTGVLVETGIQVRARQHDQPAPLRSRDQPGGARTPSSAVTSRALTGSVSATTRRPPSRKKSTSEARTASAACPQRRHRNWRRSWAPC